MIIKQKNIVICLDGTGNQIEENLSNVLKLYRVLKKSKDQLVFYDQGVGTLKRVYSWGRRKQKLKNFLGQAFGYGLDSNVLQAYEFLIQNYAEHKIKGEVVRDRIYIFGFSRGSHTARVLAGLIYEIGILRPEQIHLSGAALTAYRQSQTPSSQVGEAEEFEGEGANFRRIANPRIAAVKFLGVFDTVSSVFVPNANGTWPPLVREKLPHTLENPAVETFRHAVSIDERRRMFRVDHWKNGQVFKPNRYSQGVPELQDASEAWFSGFHSDVGGGHDRQHSGISQFPLIWMLGEAERMNIQVSGRMAKYVSGIKPYTSKTKYLYPEPEVTARTHNSMSLWWQLLEYFPKNIRYREWPDRKSFMGYYLPLSEPRFISSDASVDSSVRRRMNAVKDYKPENLQSLE